MQLHFLQAARGAAFLIPRGWIVLGLALAAWALLLAPFTLAQELATGAVIIAEPTFIQQLLTAILPAVGVLISAVLLYGAAILKQKTGIDIEAKHREALQSALLSGILFAIQKAGWLPGDPVDKLLAPARGYVEHSVPDALAKFGIDTATDIGKATLDRLLTPKLPVAIGTIMPNGDKLVGRAS